MTDTARRTTHGLIWVVVIGVIVVALDQTTKWFAIQALEGEPTVQVIGDWFRLTFVRNPGAAFSIGTQYTWIFSIAAAAVSIVILIASRRVRSRLWLIAMGALLGGAVGNLIDRFSQPPGAGEGHVVDFIEMPFLPIVGGTVFNVADMSVVGAAIMMVVLSILGVDPAGPSTQDHESDTAEVPASEPDPTDNDPAERDAP